APCRRILHGLLPFALVGRDDSRHVGFELRTDAERILADDLLEIVESAFQVVAPRGGALQPIRRADIEHEKAVDVADESRLVEIGGEQLRVARLHAAVAADIEIPAFLGGDHTDVLRLRLRAFARTARDTELQLVGRAQPLVTALQLDREADAVLHAIPAPCRAHAGLHRPQGLAVRMPRLEAGCYQVCP